MLPWVAISALASYHSGSEWWRLYAVTCYVLLALGIVEFKINLLLKVKKPLDEKKNLG
jgi:hypothetical protein